MWPTRLSRLSSRLDPLAFLSQHGIALEPARPTLPSIEGWSVKSAGSVSELRPMTGSALESHSPRNPLLDATAGALAGCISRLVIGPLDVLKIRFQVQLEPIGTAAQKAAARHAASKYTGIGQALKVIAAEEGIQVGSQRTCQHVVMVLFTQICYPST